MVKWFSIHFFQIVQDFNLRHPQLNLIVYERWPVASKLLIRYAEESSIDYKKTLGLHKPKSDLSEGKENIIILTTDAINVRF